MTALIDKCLDYIRYFWSHKNTNSTLGVSDAPVRLLVIANAKIPTVQLSIIEPLKALIQQNQCSVIFLTEQDLKKRFGKRLREKESEDWALDFCENVNPTHFIFCRYSGPHAKAILNYAKNRKLPSIYNIDDDLLNVPIELGQKKYDYHNHPKRLGAVRHLLNGVDVVYCSNERLKTRLLSLDVNAKFFVGEIYCAGKVLAEPRRSEVKKIGYMGYDHKHDFEVMLPSLVRILQNYQSISFELFGKIEVPPVLEQFGSRVKKYDVVENYDEFMEKMVELNWDIGICPLADTDFNKVKNINKWIEYTSVGTAVVASKGRIYDGCCSGGCGVLVEDSGWYMQLEQLILSPSVLSTLVDNAQKKLVGAYSYDLLAQQLLNVFDISNEAARIS